MIQVIQVAPKSQSIHTSKFKNQTIILEANLKEYAIYIKYISSVERVYSKRIEDFFNRIHIGSKCESYLQ